MFKKTLKTIVVIVVIVGMVGAFVLSGVGAF